MTGNTLQNTSRTSILGTGRRATLRTLHVLASLRYVPFEHIIEHKHTLVIEAVAQRRVGQEVQLKLLLLSNVLSIRSI
jgi:hypothetical protein